ncbi:MAG: aldehyde ferredoxin oxidoreductase family protein [bacterium]
MGRGLYVDLGTRSWEVVESDFDLLTNYMGGRGLGVALLRERALSDPPMEAPLVFSVGPLTDTGVPAAGRFSLVSKSPLTGTIFDCSCGGKFGHKLKRTGFDYIFIDGRSNRPIYLRIRNGEVQFEDASGLWGRGVAETEALLRGLGSVAAIGPAGERGVLFASIMVDGNFALGRGGLGAVMGYKNLKAIAIDGDHKTKVHDPEGIKGASRDILRLLKASPAIFGELGLREFGTAALVDLLHARRMMPADNFRRTFFENSWKFSGYTMSERYHPQKHACFSCPIACKKRAPSLSIPEFETVSHFGALNGNDDLDSIVEANRLCNDYGLDTISAASTIACYGEIRGEPVSPKEILELLHLIAERRGIGDELSWGSRRFAESQGRRELSMSVKGLELPAYDPRGAYGMALAYATSNRGGCHLRAYPISHEILRKPVATNRFSFDGKARIVKIAEDSNAAVDSLVACRFAFFSATLEEYAKALSSATGVRFEAQDLMRVGERIYVLERYINSLNGFSRADDSLPERFFREEGSSGNNIHVKPLDRRDFEAALSRYYRARGCDENGVPSPEKLGQLGIKEYDLSPVYACRRR